MRLYSRIDGGFRLTLDPAVYARSAVMKALYKFQNRYIISYEYANDQLCVDFEGAIEASSLQEEVRNIMRELSFQMLRYDTMLQTKHIRELLVARALYASCIEDERGEVGEDQTITPSWREDSRNIFASWASEQ